MIGDWIPFVALLGGAASYFGRMIWVARKNARSPVAWESGIRGVIIAGESILSPAMVPCVGYGIVLSSVDTEAGEEVVEHRGGLSSGFRLRAADGRIVVVPKGPIEVDGASFQVSNEDLRGVNAYLAEVSLIDDEQLRARVSFNHAMETRLEIGQRVTVVSDEMARPPDGGAYRGASSEWLARGRTQVRID